MCTYAPMCVCVSACTRSIIAWCAVLMDCSTAATIDTPSVCVCMCVSEAPLCPIKAQPGCLAQTHLCGSIEGNG